VGLTVRDAAPADAAAIADVHIRTWQVAYAHAFPAEYLAELGSRRAQRERFWRNAIESPAQRAHILVAEDAECVVGFASVGRASDEDAGELYAIYVLPEAWGRGPGPALLAEALERLRSSGFREAILWVLDDNPRARAFYERSGLLLDGATREGTHLETVILEVRYRIQLQGD
jgi:ribosomal protein S18 acetylase RimI-like enzyme